MFNKKKGFLKNDTHIEVSLTPLIDTLLVLLIVFMIATPFVYHALHINLPTGNTNVNRDSKHDIFIAIDQYGRLYNTQYECTTLTDIMRHAEKALIDTPHLAVIIYADKDVLYGSVSEVIDALRNKGVRHVYCRTKKIQP